MTNIMQSPSFPGTTRLVRWATTAAGADVYEDYRKYTATPAEARKKLDPTIKYNYDTFMTILTKMASYENHHWWITYESVEEMERASKHGFPDVQDIPEETSEDVQFTRLKDSHKKDEIQHMINFRKKVRVWYQIFDAGITTLLVTQSRILDDCNDILQQSGYYGYAITSWMLHQYGDIFEYYKEILRKILMSDAELMGYVERHSKRSA